MGSVVVLGVVVVSGPPFDQALKNIQNLQHVIQLSIYLLLKLNSDGNI